AGPAAVATARRVAHALAIAQQRDRRRSRAAKLDHLAEPAAIAAGAARARAKLAPMKHHRRDALGRLDRDGADPRRKGGGAEPVLAGPRAGAAAMKDDGAELRQRVGVGALFDLIDQRAAAENLRVPERGGAFR